MIMSDDAQFSPPFGNILEAPGDSSLDHDEDRVFSWQRVIEVSLFSDSNWARPRTGAGAGFV